VGKEVLVLADFLLGGEESEHLATRAILKSEVEFLFVLETHFHLDEEGMLDRSEDLLLCHYLLLLVLL
jgi:hypothetical protein